MNTSEKNPAPIFSQVKSSIRARLDTALRRARYEEGRTRFGPWTLWMGGSAPSRSESSLSMSHEQQNGRWRKSRRRRNWTCAQFKKQPGSC